MNLAIKQNLYNPLDTIEAIFERDEVSFDRRSDNELVAEVLGKWDNMLVFFSYEEHMRCLHISCLLSYWLCLMKIYGLVIFHIGVSKKCQYLNIQ